uniref:Retrotransposon gag domain-containing protein n=1 Tax=Magallana gigas TaxID=29159 RepID=K1PRR6_MAGGI
MAHIYEPPTTERPFNVSHARIPAASQCPSDYARIPAAYIHPPEYSWRPAAAYGLPGDVQTPAARYNLQEFVAPPTSYHNPTTWSRPNYKDLHFDGRTSWKPFLHKFVRLSRSQRWAETEYHDQFCFFLEETASEYYTLLLETSPDLRFADILRKFDKRFGSAAPDLAHQLNFQSAVQNSGESLRQWSDRVLTLAARAFPQLPDHHTQAIPRLCYGAEERDASLDGHPKTVDEAVDRMHFYRHSRQSRLPCTSYHAVRSVVIDEESSKRDGKAESQIRELKSRVQLLEKTLKEVLDSVRLGVPTTYEETKTYSQAPSGQLRTVCLLTQSENTSFRKHPADDSCVVDKDAPCPNIRRRRKRGRRRMRRRRPNLLKSFSSDPDVPEEEVTPVDSNCRLQVLRSKLIPTESLCPEARARKT